jgi:hypothetical protein
MKVVMVTGKNNKLELKNPKRMIGGTGNEAEGED